MQERLPFDPARLRRPAADAAPPGPSLLSVRQVNELVSGALARNLPPTLHVLGEIGDLSRPASGHVYFTLKDAASELRCVMWRSTAARLKFAPEPGLEVIATGGIEVYLPRGSYQLIVTRLEPRGVGALEIAFRQLRERLEREGLFAPGRKKPLPRIPARVAVVTSPSGAAIRDILHTLARRFPALDVLVFPVRVQGAGAAEEIAAAIRALNAHNAALGGIDVMIVGRGGGSLEDLWAFNEEIVARAIAASRIPVVSAVGHEVDVTISDLVADLRAPTPTAAAELITPAVPDLITALERAAQRAGRAARHGLELARARLGTALAYDGLARPLSRLHARGQLVDELQQRLRLATVQRLRRLREQLAARELALLRYGTGARFQQLARRIEQRLARLAHVLHGRTLRAEQQLARSATRVEQAGPAPRLHRLTGHLRDLPPRLAAAARNAVAHRRRLLLARLQAVAASAPAAVLKRGYSITREARTGRILRSIAQVRDGLRIRTQLADGEFTATADDPQQPRLFDP